MRPLGCVDIESLEFMTEHFQSEGLTRLLERWHLYNSPLFMPFVAIPLEGLERNINRWLKRAADDQSDR